MKTRRKQREDNPRYLPSPYEIEEECRKLRESWNERERNYRANGMEIINRVMTVPEVICHIREGD